MDFYVIRRKRLDEAKNILNRISYLLDNSYLRFIINRYINAAIENKSFEIEYSNPSELIINSKNNKEIFSLAINDNLITMNIKTLKDEIEINLCEDIDNNKIIYSKKTLTPHRTRSLKQLEIERIIYIDNDPRYIYQYTALEDTDCMASEHITVSDTYIDLDKHAVRQEMTLSGYINKEKDVKINYFKADLYNDIPFNNLVKVNREHSTPFIPATKDEYLEFISGDNNLSPIL